MAEYIQEMIQNENGYSYGSGVWRNREAPHELKPDSLYVSLKKLAVGDIVLIHDYRADVIRSAVITAIEQNPKPEYCNDWKVTTVDGKGKVDTFNCHPGKVHYFERQCSQEVKENVEERGRNISLRRDIQRLEGKVEDLVSSMEWFGKNGGKNPKMPTYLQQVKQFAIDLAVMYDDVGNDLGLPTRAERKKKREEV